MHPLLAAFSDLTAHLSTALNILLILVGFSVVVFFHELGHFAVAKWAGIRVERFAIGFGAELIGLTRGETRYSFNVLPFGGYVKMLGQEDFDVDATGELAFKADPRSFANKPVGHRMAVVSAGVIMNLILAALLFMVVFMVGKTETEPIVGQVVADSPAAKAGLQVGDRVQAINGFQISSFEQISTAVKLAEPLEPLRFEIVRDGELQTRRIVPTKSDLELLQVGIAPSFTDKIVYAAPEFAAATPAPRPGDRIVEVNGTPIDPDMRLYVLDLLLQKRNQPSTAVLERPDPEHPGAAPQRLTVAVPKFIAFEPNGAHRDAPRDLLGLIPRVQVSETAEKGPAAAAGLLAGDIIVRWAEEWHPTAESIRDSLLAHEGEDVPVVVRRGETVLDQPLYFRSKVRTADGDQRQPQPGCAFILNEQSPVVIAGIHPRAFDVPTPAAATTLGKGCRITAADGTPVAGWADLAEHFRTHAGSTVALDFIPEGSSDVQRTTLAVPPSLSTLLDLPSYAGSYQTINFALDGLTEIPVQREGKPTFYYPAYYPLAVREYLQGKIGQPVEVTYKDNRGEMVQASVTVTPEMIDPWYRRVTYSIPLILTEPATYLNQQLNPLKAIWAGAMETYYFVAKTYLTLQRLIFTRSVGVEHMSGPVGIISIGAQIAGLSKIEMLYFLALISANLAVLNFLPLPIVDGGLMVFLIIEKIKGSPVGIRAQVITQVIGLALFATMFVLITFQDLAKILG